MGELLTQTKPGKASSTVFDYDTRNKTLTDKAAQNRQCSIQSVSVNNNSNNKKNTHVLGTYLYSVGSQHGNLHQVSVMISRMT